MRAEPEAGSGVIEFVVVFVGLVLPLLYAIVTMAGVQRAMLGTSSAAREAGRVWATAPDAQQARMRADRSAREMLAAYGLDDPDRGELEITSSCPPVARGCTRGFGRGAVVEVQVSYRVPVAGLLTSAIGVDLPVHATHRTRVDRFRGLVG